jgi:hypothetical protein
VAAVIAQLTDTHLSRFPCGHQRSATGYSCALRLSGCIGETLVGWVGYRGVLVYRGREVTVIREAFE